jgi:hypothetical protein
MIARYITYLLKETGLRILNFIIFPIAWIFKDQVREKKGFLWWFLHDGCDYGDEYFIEKHGNHKTFWTAYKWAMRNPCHNWYYSNKIEGVKANYRGFATCQKPDKGLAWRTLKTCDKDGHYKDKHGKWIDNAYSLLGKQRITFYIEGKKYFRYSGCVPKKIIGNVWWCMEYKFGFESTNWAIQFKPFKFKRYKFGPIKYYYINVE